MRPPNPLLSQSGMRTRCIRRGAKRDHVTRHYLNPTFTAISSYILQAKSISGLPKPNA